MSNSLDILLDLQNVSKSYNNNVVLNNVNFKVPKGVIYGFIGENGAGKTSTMNIICGLKNLSSGKILFDGKDLNFNEDRANIGYLPQHPKMYGYMSCIEYLDFILSLNKNDINIKKESIRLLEIVGLYDARNKKIKNLSGGMAQRLGIAVAISNNPKLVVLDEPTSALDPEGRRDVLNIIKSLKEQGMTVFFSTHLLADVENICDMITILHKGNTLVSSTIDELKEKYKNIRYDVSLTQSVESKLSEIDIPKFIDSIDCKTDKILINMKDNLSDERALYEFLLSLDTPIISVTKKEASLEDIFFNIIKGGEENEL